MSKQKVFTSVLLVIEGFILAAVVIMSLANKTVEGVQTLVDEKRQEMSTENSTEEDTSHENWTQEEPYTEPRQSFSAEVEAKLASMTTEEKVAQLFIVTPEEFTGFASVDVFGNGTRDMLDQYPVSGFAYSKINFTGPEQADALISGAQDYARERIGLPLFVALTEEIDVAEIEDVFTSAGCFPLEGSESGTEGLDAEIATFQGIIDEGAGVITVSNGTAPSVTGVTDIPCSMSEKTVALLREEMGYKGILMTAPYNEGTITTVYGSGEAAVSAIIAGMDMVYLPADFEEAYNAVLEAVNNGTISQTRLENAVGRVLSEKME